MQKSSVQKYCSLLKPKIPQNRAPNERNAKGSSVAINFLSSRCEETYLKAKKLFTILQTCFVARPNVQINSSRYSESFEFLPTTFAITLSAVALLIVLKVEFNFEVILHTVHYHFCILNSRKLEQNLTWKRTNHHVFAAVERRKNTSPERFNFFVLSSHYTTGTYFQKYRTATSSMSQWRAMFTLFLKL